MASGKKKKKSGNFVAEKTWSKIVGDPLWDKEKKQRIVGSIPGQPRRFLQPITFGKRELPELFQNNDALA